MSVCVFYCVTVVVCQSAYEYVRVCVSARVYEFVLVVW